MTEVQALVLRQIEKFIKENGFSPSYKELARVCGYNSLATVAKHVNALQREGRVTYERGRSRSIVVFPKAEIYGFNSCANGHQEILFRGQSCPMCALIASQARTITQGT